MSINTESNPSVKSRLPSSEVTQEITQAAGKYLEEYSITIERSLHTNSKDKELFESMLLFAHDKFILSVLKDNNQIVGLPDIVRYEYNPDLDEITVTEILEVKSNSNQAQQSTKTRNNQPFKHINYVRRAAELIEKDEYFSKHYPDLSGKLKISPSLKYTIQTPKDQPFESSLIISGVPVKNESLPISLEEIYGLVKQQ